MSALLLPGGFQDLGHRHHHAEIDHLVIVALEHDADDVLADVVHVALHGRHHDLAGGLRLTRAARGFLLLHVGQQIGDRLLHHARGLHHLRQEHLAGPEQVADDVHAGHQRAFDHIERARGRQPRLLGIVGDEIRDAVHQRMGQALADLPLAPGEIGFLRLLAFALEALRDRQQPLGRILALVEDDILAGLAQFGIEIVIHRHLAGIDDAHVHAGLDRVIEEHRVHRFAHRLIAAERERQVRHAAGNMHARQVLSDPARRLDEIDTVIVVLLDAGRDREDVRIEDDVLGREADLLGQDLVGARADRGLARERVGLPLLVERHHDDRGAMAAHDLRVLDELALAFLHRDRVDHRLALHALQARLDDAELGRVDHHRHARDVGFARDQVQERHHRGFRFEKALVHVDVDHLRAVLDLVARDGERRRVVAGRDQLAEFGRAGDVGALADIDERDFGA